MTAQQNDVDTGQNKSPEDIERLREIPKWTRRYTENRTLPFLVGMATFLLFFAAIGIPSYVGGNAYRAGNMLLFWVCIFALILVCTALIFFSIPMWGGKFTEKLNLKLYGKEGYVVLMPCQKTKKGRLIAVIVGLTFGACVMISAALGVLGYIPIEYMQPVSAIYVVPFIVSIGILQRPTVSPAGFLAWLWPTLYTIHAILIIAGVPILFHRPWIALNMLIPIAGYGILCGLPGHIYSRYALKKLKSITSLEGGAADGI